MKRNLKYILFFTCLMLLCLIKVNAANVIKTCYYNFSGISKNPKEDYYVKVEFYDDNSAPWAEGSGWFYEFLSGRGNFRDYVKNWGSDDGDIKFDAKTEWVTNHECFEFLMYDLDPYDDIFYLFGYDILSGLTPEDVEDSVVNLTMPPLIFVLIDESTNSTKVAGTCEYEGFSLDLNSDGNVVSVNAGGKTVNATFDMYMNSVEAELGCLPTYYCKGWPFTRSDALLFYTSEGLAFFELDNEDCTLVQPKKNKYEGHACYKYTNLLEGNSSQNIKGLRDYAKEYKAYKASNNAAGIAESIGNYNKQKDKIREWCSAILTHGNYNDGCLKSCLDLNGRITDLEKEMGLAIVYEEDNCSLGDSVVLWIGNVVKWLKYIVPVLVIIFSILDFIKTIGSEKEDEMKKAQSKFVRRLIIAGLVFIIPLIIEFVLVAFNFNVNGCGIIDL